MWVYPRNHMGYGNEQREPGEVFELAGYRNDGLLLKHRHVLEVPHGTAVDTLPRCDACAKSFADHRYYHMHLTGRIHPQSPNYEGPEARTSGEPPAYREERLLVTRGGKPKRY